MINPTESQEAKWLMEWARLHPICSKYLIKISNEGRRSPREGCRFRLEGLKAGVSDYFLAYPTSRHHGLWIELKRRSKSNVTEQQLWWLTAMQKHNYEAKICYGWEESRETILQYLSEK